MILTEVKNYVRSHQQVSLADISVYFDVEPEAAKGMLEFWIRKGKITHHSTGQFCSNSCACSQKDNNDMYEWNQQIGNISIQTRRR